MRISSVAAAAVLAASIGCKEKTGPIEKGTPESSASSAGSIELQGAGATFPYPLYSKWVAEYQRIDPRVRINYQSIGSGGGIRQITEKTVDFGASDAPLTDAELAKAPGKLLHVPMTLGAVVIAYNLPGIARIVLSPEVVAGVFLGEIKTWNDPRISQLNPGVRLPSQAITVAHRTDGSGTTAVFTEYLATISRAWKEKVGAGKSVNFPVGLGAKGNEGVAGQVKTTPGALGYVELAYAKETGLPYAAIRNRSGKVVDASLESVTAAAAGVAGSMPADLRVSIVDAPGDGAYPISSFTYILVYEDQADSLKAKTVADFLWWAIHDGQKYGPALQYAPLPPEVVKADEGKLHSVRSEGRPVLGG